MKKIAIALLGLALLAPALPANASTQNITPPTSLAKSVVNTSGQANLSVATTAVKKINPFGSTNLNAFSKSSYVAKPSSRNLGYQWFTGLNKDVGDVYVQEKRGTKWYSIQKAKRTVASGKVKIQYDVPVKNAGTTNYFRLYHPATSKANSWASKAQKVTYTYHKLAFHNNSSANFWQAIENRWVVNTQTRANNVYALYGAGVKVVLQKKSGTKWANVKTFTLDKKDYAQGKIVVPAVAKSGNYTYRLYAYKGKYTTSATSRSITVKVEDPRKYTGYKKSTYNYVKKYCPNVIIDTAKPNKSWAGKAYLYEKRFYIVTGLSAGAQKFVGLHECAHIIQGKVYPSYDELEKSANKIYRAKNGVEQMADCMTFKMGGSTKYAGYTKNCSGTRGTAATKVLSGKKA